ncbi:hypothetical protein ABVV53_13650 [Novosphingobium sp. RD2P27]|uniref:DUF7673 domain-containing protein n=1 Tax=Novosphingobium kalidii TaxID=3230299 RepID=A0ABV2D3P5_9SPHN
MTTAIEPALGRLFDLAKSDTGQARRVANFLLAWWNGDDWGYFDIADLFGLDSAVAADMATVFSFLATHPGAIYADAFGYRHDMAELVERWRPEPTVAHATAA